MPLLTKKLVESLKSKDKPYVEWDSAIKGFGCKVHPTGRRVYLYKYRNLERKEIWITLGKHGLLTIDMARKRVSDILIQINNGIDPHAEKQKKKVEAGKSMPFKDFWEIYDTKYIKKYHEETTIRNNKSRIAHILDYFGNIPIQDITRMHMLAFEKYLDGKKTGISTFSKCWKGLLSPAFNHAELWGYRDENTNPCKKLSSYRDRKVENFMNDADKERFENVLSTLECKYPQTKALIAVSFYTGIRQGQMKSIKWDQVDLDNKIMYFDKTKTGKDTLPINPETEKWFLWVRKFRKENNPYVFPGKLPGKHLENPGKLWTKVRKLAQIQGKRWHDLRHSFASFALKKGIDLYTVSKLLGHKNIATTTRYAHLELGALKEATNKIFE